MFQVKRTGKITLLGLGLACLIATAIAAVPGIFSTVNATTGYQVNGTAGSSGQALCSDGANFDTPCTVLGSAFYQTIDANGTSQVQEPTLNLINGTGIGITCADNSGASRTDCTVSGTGTAVDEYWTQAACDVTAGAANNCSFTITLPSAMPDTSYELICQLGFDLSPNPTGFLMYAGTRSTTAISAYVTEVMGNGQSGSFSTYVDCHAHHA